MEKEQYIVTLEIGSSKIVGTVAVKTASGAFSVVAMEEEKVVECVRYGCIQNIEEIVTRVNHIIKKLENRNRVTPRKIKSVYVGICGRSLRSIRHDTETTIHGDTIITNELIANMKREMYREKYDGYEILDIVPYKYIVNKQEVKNPVGVAGPDLHAQFNIIVSKLVLKNYLRRVLEERLQLTVKGYIVTPLAIAREVLTYDERQLGCMLVDFGAETTTVSIYKDDALVFLYTMPLGSRTITRDLITLNILEDRAEEVKKTIGNACKIESETELTIEGVSNIEASNYIMARAGEIAANIIALIDSAKITAADLPEGIILVGGGSKLKGFDELLEQTSKMKVRRGNLKKDISINNVDNHKQGLEYLGVLSLTLAASDLIGENDTCCESLVVNTGLGENRVAEEEPVEQKAEKQPKPKKPSRFSSMLDSIKTRAASIFNEGDDDNFDDDDN